MWGLWRAHLGASKEGQDRRHHVSLALPCTKCPTALHGETGLDVTPNDTIIHSHTKSPLHPGPRCTIRYYVDVRDRFASRAPANKCNRSTGNAMHNARFHVALNGFDRPCPFSGCTAGHRRALQGTARCWCLPKSEADWSRLVWFAGRANYLCELSWSSECGCRSGSGAGAGAGFGWEGWLLGRWLLCIGRWVGE